MRFIYYGASKEFFFVIFTILIILTVIGLIRRPVMWAYVRGLEFFRQLDRPASSPGSALPW